MKGPGQDRRPWLILSRREVEALIEGLSEGYRGPDLQQALRVIEAQLQWIDGQPGTIAPSVARALRGNGSNGRE